MQKVMGRMFVTVVIIGALVCIIAPEQAAEGLQTFADILLAQLGRIFLPLLGPVLQLVIMFYGLKLIVTAPFRGKGKRR